MRAVTSRPDSPSIVNAPLLPGPDSGDWLTVATPLTPGIAAIFVTISSCVAVTSSAVRYRGPATAVRIAIRPSVEKPSETDIRRRTLDVMSTAPVHNTHASPTWATRKAACHRRSRLVAPTAGRRLAPAARSAARHAGTRPAIIAAP